MCDEPCVRIPFECDKMKHYKKIATGILLLLTSVGVWAQELQRLYTDAMAAYKTKDYHTFYSKIKEADNIYPNHQGILYQLGIASALTGKKAEAIQYLKQAILIDADLRLQGIADFTSIKDSKEFSDLLALQREWQSRVIHSQKFFSLQDRTIHPEPIEYDSKNNVFYLGSIHQRKVVKITPERKTTDFCKSAFEGMTSVMGIKIDHKKNVLWVCSSPLQEMTGYDSLAKAMVFKFDLTSGQLLHKFVSTKKGVYGDLILDRNGKVYLSDSETNELTVVNEKTSDIEPFYSGTEFRSLQGITFSDDEKYLYMADYAKGIFRLEMKTKKVISVSTQKDVSLKGIDGLYFYNHSLVAIQNGVVPARVTRYYLSKDNSSVINFEIIDRNHPDYGDPTLGVLNENAFYYIANSPWSEYDAPHHLKPVDQLKDVVVLKAELN